ncbi:HAMP domain-containing protein [Bradyrhizobium sp. AUGA SZCCT0274]|uniref:adenylate/guanylate cyclase domain-containing protein n=1 Tax=unclassified Bradyrhizobium TaxID=2631580 RepID=UPI001BA9B509|nr:MULTISPECIES: adenylate/guanylate cyclase domain-containing protein [unclassified Bradyrhizobium]MBR1200982.1 HAMP domain-containing protein [Bradyrhizobium sp. AUGA SZCCT0158]MBR1245051.1 HAMP domain-containing protein [Bradyrhizobium sp. AUGA SZCCT0274]
MRVTDVNAAKDRVWFLREGLFAKYVVALVGLVVFVLAVNGAMEIWISYRGIKSSLTDGMSEKAEATAKRIQQSMSDLERQINWVTRTSSYKIEDRRADYAQLLTQVPYVSQLTLLSAQGREQLRLTRQTVHYGSNADFSRDLRFTESAARGTSFATPYFRDGRPFTSISLPHSDSQVTVAEINLGFLQDFFGDTEVGRTGFAYIVDSKGQVLASSSKGPEIGKDVSSLPQVAAIKGSLLSEGTDIAGNDVLTTVSAVPRIGWFVFFEQPTAQALTPIREQLLRIALLIAMGLVTAIIAGTVMARRMLVPINALRAGAHRLGGGDFSHRIEVKTSDELEELADQFNGMASQLAETYSGLEAKVKERTRDLAQSINELKVLEEVGRAVSSSLDLNAVLPTVAARALEITHADAVLIYGYDVTNRQFNLTESIGIDKAAEGKHLAIEADNSPLGEAAARGEPIAIPDLDATADHPLRDVVVEAGFHSVLVVPLVDQQGILGSLVVLRQNAGEFSDNLIGLMKTFAHQSVLAMRNARLFSEVDHKSRELEMANATVREQADKLLEQTDQLKDWNRSLEERVETQLGEIERIRRLERFLAPQVAQLIASGDGHEGLLDSHRREVTVVFCDMRGFTSFTETTEPEEAMNVLREYHAALGALIFKYEGTLDRYAGDGVMILFNAPIQFEDHVKRAVKMSVEMRDTVGALTEKWRNRGHNLGFGIGIALGYATLGQIGFEQRLEYAAIGSVTNLASRLCDEAKANQIVVSRRVYGMVEQWVEGHPIDDLNLKGFNHPILAAEITSWREEVDNVVDAASAARRQKKS